MILVTVLTIGRAVSTEIRCRILEIAELSLALVVIFDGFFERVDTFRFHLKLRHPIELENLAFLIHKFLQIETKMMGQISVFILGLVNVLLPIYLFVLHVFL